MRVRFLLNLASGVSLGLTIVLGVALILSFFAINTTSSNLLLARSIRTTILERIFLRDEFYARREDRPGRQFILKSGLLASQLDEAGALFRDPRDRAIIAEVKASLDKTLAIFQKLVDDDSRNGADSEYGKMLFSQLLAKGYILNDDAARLELRSMATLASLNRNLLFLILACLAIVVALILVNNILIGRTLGMGIRRLQDGAASVGGGNLKFRFELRSDDEIADVEQSINTMAESLHASFSAVQVLELEAKRRALELAVSNSELEAFAYSVAHDLRAPLRSISGFASVLEEELGPSVSGEAVRILGIIRENAGKMNILISELLDITRLGRTALNLSRVNMEAVATEALSTVAGPDTAGDFDILVGVLPEVDADSAMIARVWANLLSNAIKYSLPSPVHAIEIGGYANEGMTTYFIKDRGVGFDQRYAGKLFGMFERLHDQKDFSGNGVGLAIVKRIVARHGGRVWAEGEVGAGATFYFSLPSPADAAGPAASMKEDPNEDIPDPLVKHDLERRVVERRAQLESFAYLVAHSLKAPLRAIAGFSSALLEDYQAILDDEGRRLLGLVVENAGTMQRLIADLLKLSRVERLEIESSRIDMKSMAIAMFCEAADPEERAALSFAVDEIPEAEGDSILIRLAWRELLENAVKFTRCARRREIRVGSETGEAETRYSVSDTGAGFDMAYVGKLFQVFQRLHSSVEFEGSGVGLVIVKSIIERHGGRVGAEGRRGEGATFWFTLPHAAATAATVARAGGGSA